MVASSDTPRGLATLMSRPAPPRMAASAPPPACFLPPDSGGETRAPTRLESMPMTVPGCARPPAAALPPPEPSPARVAAPRADPRQLVGQCRVGCAPAVVDTADECGVRHTGVSDEDLV